MKNNFNIGELVEVCGREFRIIAINHDGKMILRPNYLKEGIEDMTLRLQSVSSEIKKLDPAA